MWKNTIWLVESDQKHKKSIERVHYQGHLGAYFFFFLLLLFFFQAQDFFPSHEVTKEICVVRTGKKDEQTRESIVIMEFFHV